MSEAIPSTTQGFTRMCQVRLFLPLPPSFLPSPFLSPPLRTHPRFLRRRWVRYLFPSPHRFVFIRRAFAEHATEPDYTQVISIRSLIIGGTRDAHSPPTVLEALAVSLHGTQMSHLKDE